MEGLALATGSTVVNVVHGAREWIGFRRMVAKGQTLATVTHMKKKKMCV